MEEKANIFEFSCRKATELVEKRSVFRLTLVEKTQLFLHSLVCDGCRQYVKQSRTIDQLLSKNKYPTKVADTNLKLDKEAKGKIISLLDKK